MGTTAKSFQARASATTSPSSAARHRSSNAVLKLCRTLQHGDSLREEILQIHTVQRSPTAVCDSQRNLTCPGDSLGGRTGNSGRRWCIASSHFQCCKTASNNATSGVRPAPFRQDVPLCPRKMWSWETLTPQPRLQISFLPNAPRSHRFPQRLPPCVHCNVGRKSAFVELDVGNPCCDLAQPLPKLGLMVQNPPLPTSKTR